MTTLAPCCVCNGVASLISSALGPGSFAYCRDCYGCGAQPYWFTVASVALDNDDVDESTMASVLRAGKTAEQWWADVAAARAEIAAGQRIDGEVEW